MYNKVFLIGNLTRDPELRYTTSGIPVSRFALAVNRIKSKNSAGSGQDVDFINIVAWRRLAEICGEYLKKGSPVAIEGRLQVRTFEAKQGGQRTMTEVIADNMQMLGRKGSASSQGAGLSSDTQSAKVEEKTGEEEIPF